MIRTARILFLIVGGILPILIGGLHTLTHFTQLTTPEVTEALSGELPINGQMQSYWHTWGIMSFMMGVAFIIIGLLNIQTYRSLASRSLPPSGAILIMLAYLGCVIYAGYEFEQMPQFWGGIIGFLSMFTCLVLVRRLR